MNDDAVIRVEGVSVRLGDVPVLDGVSASVERGRFVGLVGPNGAGKTTLLRTLNAALTPDAGRVLVADEDVHDLPSRAASRLVASVPQDTALSFDFTVRETVAMGRTPYRSRFGGWGREDTEAVDSALARTTVSALADRPVTAVSGGERQRVLLARALAQDAPVFLLDEPTGHLDVNHQVRTLELVRELVAGGKTVVAAIHDLNLAARYCDELLLLSGGDVLASGPPADVLTVSRLRTAFDARTAVSRDPVTGSRLVTPLPDRSGDRSGRVHVVCGGGRAGTLFARLAAAGYEVTVGAVPAGSADATAADALGIRAVTVPPFAAVDEDAADRVRSLVRAADAVVVADVPLTAGARRNLDAATVADAVVVVDRRLGEDENESTDRRDEERRSTDRREDENEPVERRDDEAVSQYISLRARGAVVGDDTLLPAVAAAVEAAGEASTVEETVSD